MVKNAFDSFIDLITFDQSLFVMEKEIQTLTQEVSHLEKVLLDYAAQVQAGNAKIKIFKKEVESKEHQMKDFDEQEKKSKERLAGVKNDREHQAIKEEINRLKKKQHDYESTLITAWNSLETLEKEMHKHEQELVEKKDAVQALLDAKKSRINQLEKLLQSTQPERIAKEKQVPEEWMEKYSRMRNCVPNPVVPVLHGSCTACFYNIPHQDFLLVLDHQLIECKGCYRFLYSKEHLKTSGEIAGE